MLVKDFDEVDKYLVDAQQLFTNIKDLKEIEAFFDLPPENLEHVRRFWETLRGKGRTFMRCKGVFSRSGKICILYMTYIGDLAT